MKYRLILFIVLAIIPFLCFAQGDRLQIGTNLSGASDWNAEQPFVNIMKFSRPWITQNNGWVGGGENPWDTQFHSYFEFDENGYPLQVPVDVPGAEAPQIVLTVWAHGSALPTGDYVCLYDGEGSIDIGLEAEMISNEAGRVVFHVPETSEIFSLRILQSTRGNHVRNIRVLVPGSESIYQDEPFQKDWLEKLSPFTALRFMDWSRTNDSQQVEWQNRPQVDDYTYTTDGIPFEWMITLCNRLGTDAWLCIPHRANDDYVREMARLFRDNLNPELKIYLEWSNEVWNWMFPQAHYGLDSLDQNLEWPERLGPKIGSVMQIWTQEFGGQENRLVRVLAMQHMWPDLVHRVFANLDQNLIDAFSPAAYVGISASGFDAMTTAADVWTSAYANFDEDAMPMWRHWFDFATTESKRLVYYEGGQHFTPDPFGSDQPYNQILQDVQTSSEMYALYTTLLDSLEALNRESLFMNFSFVGQKSGKYGSWGCSKASTCSLRFRTPHQNIRLWLIISIKKEPR